MKMTNYTRARPFRASCHKVRAQMVVTMAVILMLAAGLTVSVGAAASSSELKISKNKLLMVASVINKTDPYMAANIKGAKAIAQKLDIPLKILVANGSSQTEISKIQSALVTDKTVIMFVNTVSSSDAPSIVNAVKRAGGYVTIWWNKPRNYKPSNVGDHFVAFQKMPGIASGSCNARGLGKALHGKGNVIVLPGIVNSTTSQTRVAGFRSELKKKFPNIKILESRPSNWSPQLANKNAKDLIAKYGGKIDGVYSADDSIQIGAIAAFKQAGLLNHVKFAADGLYPDTIRMMENPDKYHNAIVSEVFQRGYMASAIGLYTAYLAAEGKIVPHKLPHEKRESLFKLHCVTPDNYKKYLKYTKPSAAGKFVDRLVKNGPWNTPPMPLVGPAPEKMPSNLSSKP